MQTLLAWIGSTDLKASTGDTTVGLGPIGQALAARNFDRIILLTNWRPADNARYQKWLQGQTQTPCEIKQVQLSGPTEFGEIYQAVTAIIAELREKNPPGLVLTYHLSPGTPAMAAVWIIVAKTRFPAELIESSPQTGVRTVSVPFDISAEFIPRLLRQADEKLENAAAGFSLAAEFSDIIFQSQQMREAVEQANIFALHNVPVLIQGESGTGKELFAQTIHRASQRKDKPFVAVNCGAISAELIESELYGHEKGAFTGADKKHTGFFRQAHTGTLFLDEIGEMPLRAQVRLLRVLQEKEITPVGSSRAEKIDVRVISATNRNLLEEVAHGHFREDLFYRLAVFPLYLPPLRERAGDLSPLINTFLDQLNRENVGQFWKEAKVLAPAARNALLQHHWPGNIRELQNTLLRACVLAKESLITQANITHALLVVKKKDASEVLNRPMDNYFSLPEIMAQVASHYLERALVEAGGNKTMAARLVGLKNYQTFDNWLRRYKTKQVSGI
jgi:transcriptional regulator with PAS, ATPase and Fis domain